MVPQSNATLMPFFHGTGKSSSIHTMSKLHTYRLAHIHTFMVSLTLLQEWILREKVPAIILIKLEYRTWVSLTMLSTTPWSWYQIEFFMICKSDIMIVYKNHLDWVITVLVALCRQEKHYRLSFNFTIEMNCTNYVDMK